MELTTAGAGIVNPLQNLWNSFAVAFPSIIYAIVILVIGYVIAFILGHAVKIILQKIGLDRRVAQAQLTKAIGKLHLSALLGEITKWYIFILFLRPATDILQLGALSDILNEFALWLPNVIAAVLIIVFGLLFAQFVALKIEEHTKAKGAKLASGITKAVLTFIIIVMALDQIGIDVSILENTFLIILAGIALAIGLAFGLGCKREVEGWIKDIKKYF